MRPSLIITNCDKGDLSHYLGERAVDRLRDNGGLMAVCNWLSYRAGELKDHMAKSKEMSSGPCRGG
jgi:hypothetical protein